MNKGSSNFLSCMKMRGGLIERGAYFKFLLKKGLIREEGLIERGVNRAFTVSPLLKVSIKKIA